MVVRENHTRARSHTQSTVTHQHSTSLRSFRLLEAIQCLSSQSHLLRVYLELMACPGHCFSSTPLRQLPPSPPPRLALSQAQQRAPSSSCQLPELRITCLRLPLERNLRKCAACRKPTSSPSPVGCGSLVLRATGHELATSSLLMQEIDFTWKGGGSEVLLTGDFLGWETKLALAKGVDGAFHAKQKLSPGNYRYKYIVDGKWLHSPDCPAFPDGTGGFANQIIVTDPLPSSMNTPRSNSSLEETGSNDAVKGPDHPNIAENMGAGLTEPSSSPSVIASKDPINSVKLEARPKEEEQIRSKDPINSVKLEARPKEEEQIRSTPKVSPNKPTDSVSDSANAIKSEARPKPVEKTTTTPRVAPAGKVATGKPAKKVTNKPLAELISEDVIPVLKAKLEREEAISNVEILFEDNTLEGSFTKNGVIYSFWAYFPDGNLEGSRGFSLSSHGGLPSTIEPFLIDERKVSAELVVFWITKRLFAQKLLSLN